MPLSSLSNRERCLLSLFALLLLAAISGPAISASGLAGAPFADEHPWGVLPNAMDVLSNLPFAAIGIWGIRWLRWLDRAHEEALDAAPLPQHGSHLPVNSLDCAWMFFAGLILTALGSAFYHLQPDDMRLAADRAGMAVAFAGLVGLATCERVSARAGWPAAWFTLVGGLLTVAICHETGNALPWALVQFGGIALLLLVLAISKPLPGALPVRWSLVLLAYAVAKLFEVNDHAIYEATGQLFSGHTLKHVIAAFAAWPVIAAVAARGERQNGRQPAAHAA